MLVAVLQGAAMLAVPALIMKFRNKGLVKGIGSIGMSYLAGILVALIFFGINKAGANVTLNASVGESRFSRRHRHSHTLAFIRSQPQRS